tara:strand:- start:1645 stop:2265 length:621 start_codon:yes stop_codon:yes gene_type:complete
MGINKTKFKLGVGNFYSEKFNKTKIVLRNSSTSDMRFFNGWLLRRYGEYKKVTAFTVDTDGKVYQHYNPECYSDIMGNKVVDKETIGITIVNQGWLRKDSLTNRYKDWIGNIYNGDDIVNKEWRGYFFWTPYTKKQMESVGKLVERLCNDHKIEKNSISHNVMSPDADKFSGVLSRSNFSRDYVDVSPSFDFNYIDNRLLNEKTNG